MNTINLYLYHLAEDPYYRNLPGNLRGRNPASTTPMSLIGTNGPPRRWDR